MFADDIMFPFQKKFGNNCFILDLAKSPEQLEQVFRLRYRIFNQELQEGLISSEKTGLDQDEFDKFCDHLLIIDAATTKIVGTYRLHRYDKAQQGHGYYSETEFNLDNIKHIHFLEIGRACIEPTYRDGSVMNALWYGLTRYMRMHDIHHICGCASLDKHASAESASLVYAYAKAIGNIISDDYCVYPLEKNKVVGFDPHKTIDNPKAIRRQLPALLRGYFAINCYIAGEPAYDPEFEVIDFFVMVSLDDLKKGPGRRFLT